MGQTESLRLGNLLELRTIVAEMRATNRWDALDELLDALVVAGQVAPANRDAVAEALKARERMTSTGLGLGIAIPHAQMPLVDHVVAAFGRSTQGIDFESLDGQPVKLVVLFLIPKGQFQQHLRTLAGIARMLNDKAFRTELEQSRDAAAILDSIQKKSV
jgi:mannitol/fructose-specific phosphotransferase system IIA component (Ntr-type)